MKTAVSGFLLAETHSLEGLVRKFGDYGLRRIELWRQNIPVLDPTTPHLANRYQGRDVAAAREILAYEDVEAVCLSLDGAFNPLAGDPDEYGRSFLHALDVCTELGIGLLNHYCYNFALAACRLHRHPDGAARRVGARGSQCREGDPLREAARAQRTRGGVHGARGARARGAAEHRLHVDRWEEPLTSPG